MKSGKFIVFESLNGGGKGEQIFRLAKYIWDLDRANTVFLTREPNEFDTNGKMVRKILATDGDPYENSLIVLEHSAKNRKTHNEIFGPMLNLGIDVLDDRYYYSSLVYQHAQGIPYEKILGYNEGILLPDLTYILNTSPEETFRRKNNGLDIKGRKFDSDIKFNHRVLENYLELGEILPNLMNDKSIVYVNGMKSIEDLWIDVKNIYDNKFL